MNKVLDLQQMLAYNAAASYEGKAAQAKSSSDNSFKDLMSKPADSDKAAAYKKEQPKKAEAKKPDQADKEIGKEAVEDKEQDEKDKTAVPVDIVLLSDLLIAHGDDSEAAMKAFLEAGSQMAEEVVPAIVNGAEETITAFTTEAPVILQEEAVVLGSQAGNSFKELVNPLDLTSQQALSEALPAQKVEVKESGKSQPAGQLLTEGQLFTEGQNEQKQVILPEQEAVNSKRSSVFEETGKNASDVKPSLAEMELKKVSPDGFLKVEAQGVDDSDEAAKSQKPTGEPETQIKASGSDQAADDLLKAEKAGKSEKGDKLEHLAMQQETQPTVKTDTEIVKIKVADPYTHLNQENVQNLADQITKNLIAGKEEFQVQMNPEHLGKITVKIAFLAEGVKVTLSCESQKTMNLLAEKAGAINQIVEQNTHAPVQVEVQEGNQEQQRNAADQNAGQNRSQEERSEKKSEQTEADDFIQQLRLGIFGEMQVS